MQKVPDVIKVEVDLGAGEATVSAKPGKVKAERLIKAVQEASDGEHSFKARVKKHIPAEP